MSPLSVYDMSRCALSVASIGMVFALPVAFPTEGINTHLVMGKVED